MFLMWMVVFLPNSNNLSRFQFGSYTTEKAILCDLFFFVVFATEHTDKAKIVELRQDIGVI